MAAVVYILIDVLDQRKLKLAYLNTIQADIADSIAAVLLDRNVHSDPLR